MSHHPRRGAHVSYISNPQSEKVGVHDWSFGCGIEDEDADEAEEKVEISQLEGEDLFGRVQGMRWDVGELGGDKADGGYEGGESAGDAGSARFRCLFARARREVGM